MQMHNYKFSLPVQCIIKLKELSRLAYDNHKNTLTNTLIDIASIIARFPYLYITIRVVDIYNGHRANIHSG